MSITQIVNKLAKHSDFLASLISMRNLPDDLRGDAVKACVFTLEAVLKDRQFSKVETHYSPGFIVSRAVKIAPILCAPRFSFDEIGLPIISFINLIGLFPSRGYKRLWVDGSLLESLAQTNPPSEPLPDRLVYPTMLVIFPKKNAVSKHYKEPVYGVFVHQEENTVAYGYIAKESIYSGSICTEVGAEIEGYNPDNYLSHLVANILNAIVYQSELLTEEPSRGFGRLNNKKLTRKQQAKASLLPPTWIGRGYKPPSIGAKNHQGTHASPITHWRRGHFADIQVGPRDNPRYKRVWRQPVLVNAKL